MEILAIGNWPFVASGKGVVEAIAPNFYREMKKAALGGEETGEFEGPAGQARGQIGRDKSGMDLGFDLHPFKTLICLSLFHWICNSYAEAFW
jgi:hypothetical protein